MNPFSGNALLLRRRSVWEAADSGILLWRRNFVRFIPFFVLPVALAALGLRFLLNNSTPLPFFALWWLKPIFDRMVLHVVSARFFGAEGSAPSRFWELCKGLWEMRRGLLGDILWRRFSPCRAARMPIRVLERVGGEKFSQRKNALANGGLNFCVLISFLGLALEAFLLLSQVTFVSLLSQMFFPAGLERLPDGAIGILVFAAFCVNYILVGSLYVCMGFGLYINSRVEVEGWDLQLLFKKFAATSTVSKVGAGAAKAIAPALLLCLFLALPQPARADPAEPMGEEPWPSSAQGLSAPDAQSLELLKTILASPDFGEYRESRRIGFRERPDRERQEREPRNFNWLQQGGVRHALGYILRAIAVLVIVGFAAFVVWWYLKNRRGRGASSKNKGKCYVNPIFSPESPESLFSKAEFFFRQGNRREAWAACLAGCIGACARHRAVSFPTDATEYGCLRLVRRDMPAEAGGFGDLVQSWILLAYGGRAPNDGAFEKAISYGRSLLTAPALVAARANTEAQ